MTNFFLKVNKDLFQLGLNPTEILLLAQVMEFQANTGDCFISDAVLAQNFGVSESTVTRTLKGLEQKGYITRATKNTRTGKERHITVNTNKIEEQLASVKMTDGENAPSVKMTVGQASNCLLGNKQNDTIKDNIKRKELKDNIGVDKTVSLRSTVIINSQDAPQGEYNKPFNELTKSEKVEKFRKEFGF